MEFDKVLGRNGSVPSHKQCATDDEFVPMLDDSRFEPFGIDVGAEDDDGIEVVGSLLARCGFWVEYMHKAAVLRDREEVLLDTVSDINLEEIAGRLGHYIGDQWDERSV
jgi:hypothetical protein